ncbi:SDR family NAD(P)-dependent oxidoreductase [Salmonella enterica subsp. enterica serovar Infantis]|nr:SDR family NAD(P)-dependent oxidoreductase [Salmonella enterica subsp. enterica serovar Infantis]
MKVLVTGATSGLGRNAVEFLRNKGISVRATGRNEAMGKLLEKMGAEFVHADLTELVSSQAKVMLAGIDTLWHCSSFTSPWGTQQAFDLANVRATRRLGEWAVAWGVRNFIHISSPSLYFDYHHHRDIKEDFRPHRFANEFARSMERFGKKSAKEPPLTHYGVSKLNFDFTLDTTRAQEELGYQPIITLDEGIERTAAWLRDHGNLPR